MNINDTLEDSLGTGVWNGHLDIKFTLGINNNYITDFEKKFNEELNSSLYERLMHNMQYIYLENVLTESNDIKITFISYSYHSNIINYWEKLNEKFKFNFDLSSIQKFMTHEYIKSSYHIKYVEFLVEILLNTLILNDDIVIHHVKKNFNILKFSPSYMRKNFSQNIIDDVYNRVFL